MMTVFASDGSADNIDDHDDHELTVRNDRILEGSHLPLLVPSIRLSL